MSVMGTQPSIHPLLQGLGRGAPSIPPGRRQDHLVARRRDRGAQAANPHPCLVGWPPAPAPLSSHLHPYNGPSPGNSLVVRWLGFHTSTAKGMGVIPGWATKILPS